MNIIDDRLTDPAVVRFGFKSCTITDENGNTFPAMIGRTSTDDDGNIDFFEAAVVYPGKFKGEDVLVDYAMLKTPYSLFHRLKNGSFHTKRKYGPIKSATLTHDNIPVITYYLPAIPEELVPRLSPETAQEMQKVQEKAVEEFLTKGKKVYEAHLASGE